MNQLDWEFPASADKAHYTALLKELRARLDAQGVTDNRHYFLTAALPAGPENYGNIELNKIHQYLDWINLLAYSFYTGASKRTSFSAPLYKSSSDPEPDPTKRASYNVDAAVKAYLSSGVPGAKVVGGVPFVGHGWQGVSDVNSGLYQTAKGPAAGTWASDGVFDWKDLNGN
jgi:chitinase